MIEKKCLVCGKTFLVHNCRKDTVKYCSKDCMYKAQRGQSKVKLLKRINIKCDNCGCPIQIRPNEQKRTKHHFCSRECYWQFRSKYYIGDKSPSYHQQKNHFYKYGKIAPTSYRICNYCGKSYQQVDYIKSKFCSHECAMLYARGENHQNWKGKTKTYKCEYCGKETVKREANIKNHKHIFCSKKCADAARSKYYSGKNNPQYSSVEKRCPICGKIFIVANCRKDIAITCSIECHKKRLAKIGRPDVKGENNCNWKGGWNYKDYPIEWGRKTFKEKIRENYGFKCAICGKTTEDEGRSMSIHHIDYNKKNLSIDNLIPLCNKCHMKTNYNREYWIQHFNKKERIAI